MSVTPLSTRDEFHRSDWTTDIPLTAEQTSSSIILTHNDFSNDAQKGTRKIPHLLTVTVGLLLGGLVAAIVLALWLASPTEITTTTSTTTSTTTATSTTTTSDTTTSTTLTTTTTTIINATVKALWRLDGNANDLYGMYNGITVNGPSFVTGYTGQSNTALSLDNSLPQYPRINSPFIDLTSKSFTVEMWIYPTMLTSGDFGLFSQCQTTTQDQCLVYIIRNYYILQAFYSDDTRGVTTLSINQWYHIAFVYDYAISTQLIYLNGYLERSRASNAYQGTSGDIFIGAMNTGSLQGFTGYIDQVSLMTRAKSAAEILMDATLVCYYTFDSNPYNDAGPLGLSASNVGLVSVSGRVNGAVSFNSASTYFVVGGLTRLGTTGQSYSISLWINPTSVNGGTIVHVSRCNTACSNWCLAFIGLTSTGQIAVESWSSVDNSPLVSLIGPVLSNNTWTHVVQTYSQTNGMRLFVNGTLIAQSSSFMYSASNAPNYLYLGSFPLTVCVGTNVISQGQYYGLLDEFYLFARDLTPAEVTQLANP